MANYWRYFRLDGDPIRQEGDLFSLAVNHGGRFYSQSGINRRYRGGDVVLVDRVDPSKLGFNGFNYWANDLGYVQGPITYWYRIPGSEPRSGYLPITNDEDAVDMLQYIPKNGRILEVFIVCLGERRLFAPWELDNYDDEIDHKIYMGHVISDLEDEPIAMMSEQQLVGGDGLTQAGELHQRKKGLENVDSMIISMQQVELDGPTPKQMPKDKGKQKMVVEDNKVPRKKEGRPKKDLKRRYDTRFKGECSDAQGNVYDDVESDSSSSSEDLDYDAIVDSDYEIFDEDDEVLFQTNVDGDLSKLEEWEEMGFSGHISDGDGENSDGLCSLNGSSDENGEDVGRFKIKSKRRWSKWKEFNKKFDMKRPSFELGMAFPNSVVFKDAIRKHAVLTKKELRFGRNTRQKVKVICKTSPGCPFWIYAASPDKDTPTMYIRTLRMEHKCSALNSRVYHCHAPFIADEYSDSFINDEKWSREGIQTAVGRDFGMNVGYQMCYRAKRRAMKLAQGTFEDQYNLLESYAHELKKKNPGTSVWIQTEMEGDIRRFKRIYICIEALKVGWKAGCRKVIGLDGCHLKGVHKGQLLAAVGIDGNNGMYPIAYAVVEKECKDSWQWFLEFLQADLEIYHSHSYVFISDKQKGLELAIKERFPEAEHRHCVRHLHNNFKADGHSGLELKQLLWAAARATTMRQFVKAMEDLSKASQQAWKWLSERSAIHWSRSHFNTKFKCEILLNNLCESFNASILPARKKGILGLLEEIRVPLMVRLSNRRNAGAKWRYKVGPRVEKLLKKNADWSQEYRALESSYMRFEIHGRGVACSSGVISQHAVQLDNMACTCRRWDLSGLPCSHAIAAIYSKGWSPEDFVDEHYTQKKYLMAYEPMINPIAGVDEWELINKPIAPPRFRRLTGRPKMSRIKEPGEEPPPPGITKLPKSYYSQIKCGRCGLKGHNQRTCARRDQTQNPNIRDEVPNQHTQPHPENLGMNVNEDTNLNMNVGGDNVINVPTDHVPSLTVQVPTINVAADNLQNLQMQNLNLVYANQVHVKSVSMATAKSTGKVGQATGLKSPANRIKLVKKPGATNIGTCTKNRDGAKPGAHKPWKY